MSRRGHSQPDDDDDDDDHAPVGKVRLDKWLWAARFFKTRALAQEAIDGGKVEVNGEKAKRAKLVQANDRVQLRMGPEEWQLVVLDVANRRGSAQIAQTLYRETDEGKAKREAVKEHMRQMPQAFAYSEGRPGKQERRAIRKLRGN